MNIIFPYTPRKYQSEILTEIYSTFKSGGHMVMESATGSGKTVCALSAALAAALELNKKILYLTRTNAQQRQVMLELRVLAKKYAENGQKIYGVALQGRHNLCFLMREDRELRSGTPEELSRFCGDRKKAVHSALARNEETTECPYYAALCRANVAELKVWCRATMPTAEELAARCRELELCAYELNKQFVPDAIVVTAPYVYFFDKFIRMHLFEWWHTNIEDIILIVDEAHNLPDFARELQSAELSVKTIELAKKEAEEFGDIELGRGTTVLDFCNMLERNLYALTKTYLVDEDGLVPSKELEELLMTELGVTSTKLTDMIENLVRYGESIRDRKQKAKKLPRSYIGAIGAFLLFWMDIEEREYVKLVLERALECYCLDPAFTSAIVNECYASVHMSGTLTPLEEYRDSIGLPKDTNLASYSSPFPQEHLIVLYVPDVTTKYENWHDKPNILRIRDYILSIVNATARNTVIFFPSFNVMKDLSETGLNLRISRPLYIESQQMTQSELMETVANFKASSHGVLFAVVGGRISEGTDFPDQELELAVIVGIPYPKPTARQKALQHYYDVKFSGRGWDYTVKAPAIRKLLQSIGRIIRKETDRGVAVILDKRAKHFRHYIRNLQETNSPDTEIKDFFLQTPREKQLYSNKI